MPTTIHVALVGCGRISRKHIDAFLHHSDRIKLAALCDTDDQRLVSAYEYYIAKFSAIYPSLPEPVIHFPSLTAMLSAVSNGSLSLDLVVIATPSGLHAKQVIQCARAGLHVCTEKPMATRFQDALSMIEECDANSVRLFVVKQNRYNPTISMLRNQISNGSFGRLYMINSSVYWQRPQAYYDQDSWRGTWEFDGGALMNQASHYVDLLDWLGGPVESVSCYTATIARNIEVEDTAAVSMRWRNGALGTLSVTMLAYPSNLEGSITILGELGSCKVSGTSLNKIEFWNFSNATPHMTESLAHFVDYEPDSVYGNGHALFYSQMIDSLLGNPSSVPTGRDGLKSLELLVACYMSSRDRKYVSLPLFL